MIERPNWRKVYRGVAHTYDRDNELVPITRETLRLAAGALREQNRRDYYHNYGAAEREVQDALLEKWGPETLSEMLQVQRHSPER